MVVVEVVVVEVVVVEVVVVEGLTCLQELSWVLQTLQ